jgi:hypothetical protein
MRAVVDISSEHQNIGPRREDTSHPDGCGKLPVEKLQVKIRCKMQIHEKLDPGLTFKLQHTQQQEHSNHHV